MGDYMPTDGLRVSVSAWQRVNDNAIPARGNVSGSYVNACMAVEDAHTGGYQEALLLGAEGHVSEASSANIFVVTGGEVATPRSSDDVLPGITRDAIMTLVRDNGYKMVRAQDRPDRAVHLRRGLPDRHRRPGGPGGQRRRPNGGGRIVAHQPGHPTALRRRGPRGGRALRPLVDTGQPGPAIDHEESCQADA